MRRQSAHDGDSHAAELIQVKSIIDVVADDDDRGEFDIGFGPQPKPGAVWRFGRERHNVRAGVRALIGFSKLSGLGSMTVLDTMRPFHVRAQQARRSEVYEG